MTRIIDAVNAYIDENEPFVKEDDEPLGEPILVLPPIRIFNRETVNQAKKAWESSASAQYIADGDEFDDVHPVFTATGRKVLGEEKRTRGEEFLRQEAARLLHDYLNEINDN